MNAILRVRLLRRPVVPTTYQTMPPVTVKCTDAVALGVRHVIRNWKLIDQLRELAK